jgi:hypothetical protein
VIQFLGGSGLELFTPVGYARPNASPAVDSAMVPEPVGRGGTDDTLFGGPGNDFIDAGAGDDHGSSADTGKLQPTHWSPINMGVYDAKHSCARPAESPGGPAPTNGCAP